MHALSVKQPWAEQIASGAKTREFRTWAPRSLIGRDLLIVASRTREFGSLAKQAEGLPVGVAVCVVRVVDIEGTEGDWAWQLASPRRVEPIAIKGYAALFKVDDRLITFVTIARDLPWSAPGARSTPIADAFRKADAARAIIPPPAPASRTRSRERSSGVSYTFQDGDRPLRGAASTPAEARKVARELADKLGDYVYIMRDGINVGGEWHAARRASS